MPGTIHVSVLELVGLPSPPKSSSMGVKVSMGKQAHEMQNKEEISFALASLRDNLNVSIRDTEGNEIAHTDVETRSIVEKVIWDDLFILKGGGKIRMKLHFILTEDEQNRIRSMRESAARKKHEDLQRRRHSSAELASASGGRPGSSQDSLKSRRMNEGRSVDLSDYQAANKISVEPNVKSLNKVQTNQAFSPSKSTGSLHKLAAYQNLNERVEGQDTEQQNQLDKTPTNVRKAILSFESSPVKDESPAISATYKTKATAQSSSTTVDIPSKAPSLKKTIAVNTKPVLFKLGPLSTREEIGVEQEKVLPDTNRITETSQLSSNTRVDTPSQLPNLKKKFVVNTKPVWSKFEASAPSNPTEIEKRIGELLPLNNRTKDTARLRSTTGDDNPSKVPILRRIVAVNSENSDEKNISKIQHTNDEEDEGENNLLKKLHILPHPESSTFSLKKIREALPKRREFPTDLLNGKTKIASFDPFVIDRKWRSKLWKPSQHRAKARLFHENEHHAIDRWIFLDERIGSCVLGDDRRFIYVHEGCLSDCKQDNGQEKMADIGVSQCKSKKGSAGSKKLESNRRRPNNASFTGPAGQVVKMAIMVGFGLLVFLTRQKK